MVDSVALSAGDFILSFGSNILIANPYPAALHHHITRAHTGALCVVGLQMVDFSTVCREIIYFFTVCF